MEPTPVQSNNPQSPVEVSVVPPQPVFVPPVVPQTPIVTPVESSPDVVLPSKKKSPLILILIVILAISIISFLVYLFLKKDSDNLSDGVGKVTEKTVKYNNIAYLEYGDEKYPSLVIYNPETNEKQTSFPQLRFGDNTAVKIWKWSPSGRYLPVIASSFLDDSFQEGESYFFFYDSKTKNLIEALHVTNENSLDHRWLDTGYLDYSGDWINDTDFLIGRDQIGGTSDSSLKITYLNVSGDIKSYTAKAASDGINGVQRVFKSTDMSYKGSVVASTAKYYDVEYKGNTYKLPDSEYPPKGVIDNTLVTLFRPKGANIFSDEDKFEEIEGGNEEEQMEAILDLLYPKDKDSLILSDSDGKVVKEIPLPSDAWVSEDAVVNDKEKYVLVFQQDRAISNTKSRYLKVSLDGAVDVIYEGLPIDILTDIPITLSSDMKDILVEVGTNNYSFIDISSKKASKFCDNCSKVQISNPWLPRSIY